MAAKFFTGLPLDGPDPECVKGYGEIALSKIEPGRTSPKSSLDHSHTKALKNGPIMLTLNRKPPSRSCDENPVSDMLSGRSGARERASL
jgi:hypothetical protein